MSRAFKVLRGMTAIWETREIRVIVVGRVIKVFKGMMVLMVHRVIKVYKVLMVLRVYRVFKVCWVLV